MQRRLARACNGPLSFGTLAGMAANGLLRRSDLVWRPGTSAWVPAETVAGLFGPSAPGVGHGAQELPLLDAFGRAASVAPGGAPASLERPESVTTAIQAIIVSAAPRIGLAWWQSEPYLLLNIVL